MKSAYEILGVPEDATDRQIRIAFRRLSLTLHPDRPGGNAERFKVISAAHALLTDPEKRAALDAALRDERHRAAHPAAPPRLDGFARFMRIAFVVVGSVEAVQRARREREREEQQERQKQRRRETGR